MQSYHQITNDGEGNMWFPTWQLTLKTKTKKDAGFYHGNVWHSIERVISTFDLHANWTALLLLQCAGNSVWSVVVCRFLNVINSACAFVFMLINMSHYQKLLRRLQVFQRDFTFRDLKRITCNWLLDQQFSDTLMLMVILEQNCHTLLK